MRIQRKCSINGCDRKVYSKGLCSPHYQRKAKYGNTQDERPVNVKNGKWNPKWKGGEITDGHGRILIYSPEHPNPSYCGTHVYRYRLIVEKHLGRFLRSDEIVHHKNGIKNDDRIENLEVMSQSDHAKIHFGRFNLMGKWALDWEECRNCRTTKIRHEAKGLCLKCYGKMHPKKRRIK